MKMIQIENKSGKVKITEDINKWSVDKAIEEIGKLFGASAHASGADFGEITNCAENAVDTLELEINSPGGSIFDGYNIYNEIFSLRERGVVVTATITGMAASMASVICMACDKIQMVKHGRMMIHEASQGVRGNSDELRKAADLLDSISNDIAVIYSERTGKDVEKIREMMKTETWMNADDALKNGFIDAIFDIRKPETKNQSMSLLAKLFPGNDEVSKLEASIAENDSLRAELEASQNKVQELSGLSAIIAEKDEKITEMTAAITEKETALTAALEEVEKVKESIPAQIAAALASAGQPEPLKGDENPPSASHLETYQKLEGAEATAYFNEHEKEIRAEMRKS